MFELENVGVGVEVDTVLLIAHDYTILIMCVHNTSHMSTLYKSYANTILYTWLHNTNHVFAQYLHITYTLVTQ